MQVFTKIHSYVRILYRISLHKGPDVYFLPATFDPALKRGRRLNGAGVYKRVLTRAYKN